MKIRDAKFALRVVRRKVGDAAVVYRRGPDGRGRDRLQKLACIGPLAFSAGTPLLREAVRACEGARTKLSTGPFHPLDENWGGKIACFALVSRGLTDAQRLHHAAENLRHADETEAAWWLGLMQRHNGVRAVRALRILLEAVV